VERRKRRRKGRLTAAWSFGAAAAVGVAAWLGRRRSHGHEERRVDMTEANKQIARRIIEELFSEGRLEVADELFAPDAVGHDPAMPEPTRGPEGLKQSVAGYRGGFPDLRIRIEAQIAEGDLVTTRWTAVGTNSGEFWGQAPTGKQATVTGITIDRIADGRIVESWTNWDTFGLLQQLGMVPAAASA
jgi:steroid delta-isomerase-like uncharacterized protein